MIARRAKQLSVLVGFDLGWFACVVPAAAGAPYVGPIFVLLLAAVVLSMSDNFMGDALLLPIAAVFGYVVDGAMVLAGLFTFPQVAAWGWPVAWWMVALWVNLAVALPLIFKWTGRLPLIAALFGLIGGPLAYWSGALLGAVTVTANFWLTMAVIGVVWAITMPLAGRLLARLEGLTDRVVDPHGCEVKSTESRGAAA